MDDKTTTSGGGSGRTTEYLELMAENAALRAKIDRRTGLLAEVLLSIEFDELGLSDLRKRIQQELNRLRG